MALRRLLPVACAFVLAAPSALWGATARTQNFIVEAPTQEIAQQIAQHAEHYRKEKAQLWLGQEMPAWGRPLPVRVTVTMNGAGGATTFAFDQGRILDQNMHIEGSLDRLLASVLPHEVTHTVFAYHFRCPVPRWADEGGSVLSEDELERNRHDMLCRQLLNGGRAMPLRRLFSLRDYPREVMTLYAQGYSVTSFLVSRSSRPAFLNFIADGMRQGWDRAAQQHYGFRNVEELEQAWLAHLRNTKRQPPTIYASSASTAPPEGNLSGRVVERRTVPPAQPLEDAPRAIFRGVAPSPEQEAIPAQAPRPAPSARLMAPQFDPQPPARLGQPIPGSAPPGYPR